MGAVHRYSNMTNIPYAARLNDPVNHLLAPISSASANVSINNLGAARVTDSVTAHLPSHLVQTISSGSSTVTINNLPAARVDDSVTCDAKILSGSPNVIIGG